jgi:hypothetical protein
MQNELKPKGNGLYYLPVRKRANSSKYVPAEYVNVDKWCICKGAERWYCTNLLSRVGHSEHICVRCGGIMANCKTI